MKDMDPVDPVDNALRRALGRVEPPAGFADRVLRSVSPTQPKAAKADRQQPSRFGAPLRWAIAAALVAAVGGGAYYRAEEQRRAEGEDAKRKVLLSLSIAGTKLHVIQTKLNHEEDR